MTNAIMTNGTRQGLAQQGPQKRLRKRNKEKIKHKDEQDGREEENGKTTQEIARKNRGMEVDDIKNTIGQLAGYTELTPFDIIITFSFF